MSLNDTKKQKKNQIMNRWIKRVAQAGRILGITRSALAAILLVNTGALFCQVSDSPFVPEGYELSFCDEFEDLQLDVNGTGQSTWAPWMVGWNARYIGGNKDKAFKCDESYIGGGSQPLGSVLHEITERGTLQLKGLQTPQDRLDNVQQMPYIGGMISSQMSYWQCYGYYEIKCRFNLSQGHHWAIWLLPINNSWPPEIDIVEVVSPYYNVAFVNAHGAPSNQAALEKKREPSGPVMGVDISEYHHYAFEWTPDSLRWMIDGEVVKRMACYIHQDMYLLITPEIGGNWPGLPDASTQWPTVCEIDYIRIYENIGATQIERQTEAGQSPSFFGLLANYPNPFNLKTCLSYRLPEAGPVRLEIMDACGRVVKTLVKHHQAAGLHRIVWDGRQHNGSIVTSGCYFSRLTYFQSGQYQSNVQKIAVLK